MKPLARLVNSTVWMKVLVALLLWAGVPMKWAAITTLAVSAVWAIPLIRRAKAEEYVEPWENKRQRMLADDVVMVMRVKSLDDASAAMSRSGS